MDDVIMDDLTMNDVMLATIFHWLLLAMWHANHLIKVEVLWFGCYGVIIWFLSGKNESEWFLLFSLSDIFCVICVRNFQCAFYANLLYHVTKELCAWLITCYTFHAHCCVIYQRTITQDADVFWVDQNFIKFPSKIVCFCHFLWKYVNPIFLFRYFVVFKIDFNICENQKNEWSVCCLLKHINIDLSNFPYYFVW